MDKLLFIACLFLIMFIPSKSMEKNSINEIEIRYIDWDSETFLGHFPFNYFLKIYKYRYLDTIIKDNIVLNTIKEELLKKTDTLLIQECDDYRMVCFIKWDNGKVDTLGYGDCCVSCLNGFYFKINTNLFKLIAGFIDERCKEEYARYIREIERFYKCE